MLEVEYLTRMEVYDVVSRKAMKQSKKRKPIKGRWLDVNKGDSTSAVDMSGKGSRRESIHRCMRGPLPFRP